MIFERRASEPPLFSICIPQYNRTSFLIEALQSIDEQRFRGMEVCISDDCSTDGREGDLEAYLKSSTLSYTYQKRETNGRYDANLRSSVGLARGRYCLLMGNDDALSGAEVLQDLAQDLKRFEWPTVILANYADFESGCVSQRVRGTAIKGRGVETAVRYFRDFSYVSGVLFDRGAAQRQATSLVDGSEMYQVFLASRLLAEGGTLLGIDRVLVRKDIRIAGQTVDSYAQWTRLEPCPIVERVLPLSRLAQVVVQGLSPSTSDADMNRTFFSVARQVYQYPYFFWLTEYRRVQSWRYALGVALGMRPRRVLQDIPLDAQHRWCIGIVYVVVTAFGLVIPLGLFRALKGPLYWIAKNMR